MLTRSSLSATHKIKRSKITIKNAKLPPELCPDSISSNLLKYKFIEKVYYEGEYLCLIIKKKIVIQQYVMAWLFIKKNNFDHFWQTKIFKMCLIRKFKSKRTQYIESK